MRIVFVHGIAQEGKSSKMIEEEWRKALALETSLPFVAPFYGDRLAELTRIVTLDQAVAQGPASDDEERQFLRDALTEIAHDNDISNEEIESFESSEPVPQAFFDDRRIIAIVRALESISPLRGEIALMIVKQAYAYLKRSAVWLAVDEIVEPVLAKGPCIVIAHSLGTVVSFKLLRKLKQKVPLLVTMGSPLGLRAVQSGLGRPRAVPEGTELWHNFVDRDDMVTMGKELTKETFGGGIVNFSYLGGGNEPHAIAGYLAHERARKIIRDALAKLQG